MKLLNRIRFAAIRALGGIPNVGVSKEDAKKTVVTTFVRGKTVGIKEFISLGDRNFAGVRYSVDPSEQEIASGLSDRVIFETSSDGRPVHAVTALRKSDGVHVLVQLFVPMLREQVEHDLD